MSVSNNNASLTNVGNLACNDLTATSAISAPTVTGTTSVTAETAILDEPTLTRGSLRIRGDNTGGYNGVTLPAPSSGLEASFKNNGDYYGLYNNSNSRWFIYGRQNNETALFNGSGTQFLRSGVTGQYGSCQIDGTATGGWYGLSSQGRLVFMDNGSTSGGIYNDVDNRWILYRTGNDTYLYTTASTVFNISTNDIYSNQTNFNFRTTSNGDRFMISADASLTANDGDATHQHYQTTRYYHSNTAYYWAIGTQTASPTDLDLYFSVNRNGSWSYAGYIQDNLGLIYQMNFTGQHPVIIDGMTSEEIAQYEGLIICSNQNKYENVNTLPGISSITINESLPHVSLSTSYMQPSVFGVISTVEDSETTKRSAGVGAFRTRVDKIPGDFRVYSNSVGEGAMWVIDSHGTLNAGDYITSSNVRGYGCKQSDGRVHNYTVAKATMDCNFNPSMVYQKKMRMKTISKEVYVKTTQIQEIKTPEIIYNETKQRWEKVIHTEQKEVEEIVKDEVDLYNSETGELIGKHEIKRKEVQEVEEPDRDEFGRIIWEDDIQAEQELEYNLRYINALGEIISLEQYNLGTPGSDVFRACFIGVTYHCG